jgi:hypothetical protein
VNANSLFYGLITLFVKPAIESVDVRSSSYPSAFALFCSRTLASFFKFLILILLR